MIYSERRVTLIKFIYNGEAVGKGRPRYARRGNSIIAYTPEKTKEFEEAIKFEFLKNNSDRLPVYPKEKALYVNLYVGCEVPKSYSKKRREKCLNYEEMPTKKPDADNIIKAVLDALNGTAYEDDSQVIQVMCVKYYTALGAHVKVQIGEIGELEEVMATDEL